MPTDVVTKVQQPGRESRRPGWQHLGDTAFVLPAVALVIFIFLFQITLQPNWRGGVFISVVLGVTIPMLAGVLVEYARQGGQEVVVDDDGPAMSKMEEVLSGGGPPDWPLLGKCAAVAVLCFGLSVVFGLPLGSFLFVLWALHQYSNVTWRFALIFALIAGLLMPALFSVTLNIELWPGVIPIPIIPGWLGGGLLPPI